MKLVQAIGLSLLAAGVTTGGVISASQVNAEPKPIAATTSTTVYVNHFDGGGSWNNFAYYMFGDGGNSGWQLFNDDMKTKTPNEYDQYQYVLEIPNVYHTILFGGNPANWGGSYAQTDDLPVASLGDNGIYCGSQKPSSNHFEVGYYHYSTKAVYMLDLRGNVYSSKHYCHTFATGKSGTTWPGVEMTKVAGSNNLYKADINSALSNVIFNNNGSNQTATISSVANEDAYIVYPDNGYNKTTLDASTFIDKYMKFETVWTDNKGTGACKSSGWYTAAKSALNGKTASEKSKILEHEPTAARLQAWATANSETFNTSTGVFSSRVPTTIATEDDSRRTLIIVGIMTTAVLAGVGGYFFIKRRKEN